MSTPDQGRERERARDGWGTSTSYSRREHATGHRSMKREIVVDRGGGGWPGMGTGARPSIALETEHACSASGELVLAISLAPASQVLCLKRRSFERMLGSLEKLQQEQYLLDPRMLPRAHAPAAWRPRAEQPITILSVRVPLTRQRTCRCVRSHGIRHAAPERALEAPPSAEHARWTRRASRACVRAWGAIAARPRGKPSPISTAPATSAAREASATRRTGPARSRRLHPAASGPSCDFEGRECWA